MGRHARAQGRRPKDRDALERRPTTAADVDHPPSMTPAGVARTINRRCLPYRGTLFAINLFFLAQGTAIALRTTDHFLFVFSVIWAVIGGFCAWRVTRLTVSIRDGQIVARSWFHTVRIDLSRVQRFEVGEQPNLPRILQTLCYVRDDGASRDVPGGVVCLSGVFRSKDMHQIASELTNLLRDA
jgi:hypothetical protein